MKEKLYFVGGAGLFMLAGANALLLVLHRITDGKSTRSLRNDIQSSRKKG